jgi:menaquinone-9 beta-reductase
MTHFELIIVGGGLAGAALAKAMAEQGVRTLVLERTQRFQDRVRGEVVSPWGVPEAKALGIYDPLMQTCGHLVQWTTTLNPNGSKKVRDLVETTPARSGFLDFYHPTMQSVLLELAAKAGAEVRRGVTVTGVKPGHPAAVLVRVGGQTEKLTARLVVGADGRTSQVRGWAGLRVARDPERLRMAGLLLEGPPIPENSAQVSTNPVTRQKASIFPIGGQRFRAYFVHHKAGVDRPLSGSQHQAAFIQALIETGMPSVWFEGAESAGPLAQFECAEVWVDHPAREGMVLIGDAAAVSDPTFGQGLALTLRDVRVLRDHLMGNANWEEAIHRYAQAHDRYWGALHRILNWQLELNLEIGPQADARRARVLPRHAEEPSRTIDLHGYGPDAPSDEAARRRYFALDVVEEAVEG